MRTIQVTIAILILAAGALGAWALIALKPKAEPKSALHEPPLVSVVTAAAEPTRLRVRSQGVITPRVEIDLVPEIAGKVVEVHEAFAAGGFFKVGAVLVRIDPRDYDLAITRTEAQIAEARRELLREEAEAEQAQREWKALGGGQPSDFVLRKPHLAERRAKLAAAQADLAAARLNRLRCDLRAPFAGRVRAKQVDVGQYVISGAPLAKIYATDVAEVRLPIASDQIDYVDLPLGYRDGERRQPRPAVILSAQLGGKTYRWSGVIVRTEGALDEKTGTLFAVAQVPNPYAFREDAPPLAAGLFVQAEITGRERADLIALPQSALVRGAHQVLVVDADHKVHVRAIRVLRSDPDKVYVSDGVAAGDRIVSSALDAAVDGMKVRVKPETTPTAHVAKPSATAGTAR